VTAVTDIHVNGVEKIAAVGAAVRRLGTDRTIVNNMAKEIRAAVPPLRTLIKAAAMRLLPSRNGLNAWVAKAKITSRVRRSANNAGVTLVDGRNSQGARSDLKGIDAGIVRAPYFGERSSWHEQRVTPGFFTESIQGEGVEVFREAVVRAVDKAVEETLRNI
jgi:hypothetical protein